MTALDGALGCVGLLALVAPGWCLAKTFRAPHPLLAGFALSAVVLTNLVIGCDALNVRLTFGTLATGGATLAVAAGIITLRRRDRVALEPRAVPDAFVWREFWPFLLPLLPMAAVAIYRASVQPLFGVDTVFRWNYLAQQMLARGHLHFYPPVTAADYSVYAWPDGIAPTVAALYLWPYALVGEARAALTAPLVVFQLVLIVVAAHALAGRWFSARAAAFAIGLIACSPVVAWATVMGQETGLTAIAFTALLIYLPRTRAEETGPTLFYAGIAAALGGLAREYGLVLGVLGVGLCITRRLSWRATAVFSFTTLAGILPWYARNWIHTGNPFFNLSVAGLFPINVTHAWLNESYQTEFTALPPEAARLLLTNASVAAASVLLGAVLFWRRAGALLVAIVLVVGLWLASLGFTAAGFIGSLRVLCPAVVMACALGGAVVAHWIPQKRNLTAAIVALLLLASDAAFRALTLPANAYRVPATSILTVGDAVHAYHERPIYREITRVAGRQRLLVLGPNALLSTLGARNVPLWSPEVRYLFDASLTAPEVAARLRDANIGFVLLNTGPANERFLAHSAYFREPGNTLRLIWSDADMVLHQIAPVPK